LPEGPFAPFDFGAAASDWNPSAVNWRPTEAGLAEARESGKPVMMVIHAEWCGPCHDYARVFHDAEVAALSRHFVMILVDSDQERAVNQRYATDGTYLPRTYFLDAAGQHQTANVSNHPRFRYFFPQRDPRAIAGAMRLALR
jgi:thiol-disulfide isomerase/thioredoxin